MHKNIINTALLMAAFIAVVYFSDTSTDIEIERAIAADVQDAIITAQHVAVTQDTEEQEQIKERK